MDYWGVEGKGYVDLPPSQIIGGGPLPTQNTFLSYIDVTGDCCLSLSGTCFQTILSRLALRR